MPVKIRLSRQGAKKKPFYHIVVTDSRAPRDGRFIERIGSYNPLTNPATIDLNFDRALDWLQKGAIPTDTCKAILSQRGVMFKNHLLIGVKKGAFSIDEAENRFNTWMGEKEAKILAAKQQSKRDKEEILQGRIKAEEKVNEARKEILAKKRMEEAEALKKAVKEAAVAAESETTQAEEPKTEASEPQPEA